LGFDLTWFSCQSSERLCTRGGQKVLSLNIFAYISGRKMLQALTADP